MDEQVKEDPERMLTLKEAAIQLGYKRSGLYEIVQCTKLGSGPQIQFFQIGTGPIKFKQTWLDDFVSAHSTLPGQIARAKTPARKDLPVGSSKHVDVKAHWSLAV